MHSVTMCERTTEIPLEDEFEDVLTKAAVGQGLTKRRLAKLSGLPLMTVQGLFRGQLAPDGLQTLAPYLGLHPQKLLARASGQSQPPKQSVDALLPIAQYWKLGRGDGMWVNSYILMDRHTHQAVVFDTGVDPAQVLSSLDAHALNLAAIFITHTHRDHVEALPAIASATGCPLIFSPRGEPLPASAIGICAGHRQQIGPWTIHAVASAGHSPDGLSYLVEGAQQPLVFVGDALFALSMGGARQAYYRALKEINENILSLAPDTILCPGHGPLTTVQHELANNPFF